MFAGAVGFEGGVVMDEHSNGSRFGRNERGDDVFTNLPPIVVELEGITQEAVIAGEGEVALMADATRAVIEDETQRGVEVDLADPNVRDALAEYLSSPHIGVNRAVADLFVSEIAPKNASNQSDHLLAA